MEEIVMDILIRMVDVYKFFGKQEALSGLSFEVDEGEIFGFLGPSGAGKTTTIKLLTKQLNADKGQISIFGNPIALSQNNFFDNIGVLSDTTGFYERLTIQENLELFAGIHSLTEVTIEKILKAVDLIDECKKKASNLSKGMKQRLMLACAILHKPKLLFLDEPTSGLDPITAKNIHEYLIELNNTGTTIFLTTHNMEEADKLCDRVAILNQGKICACDTPEKLKLEYSNDTVYAKAKNGKQKIVEKNKEGLYDLMNWFEKNGGILTIHSSEPNLEEVFLKITGRNLY
ncbi:ABC transporter ATP-binding protein [Acidilutibacter cellobiosedens]|jgi:ABC-2 type transport system ATP-binding protein|nr:ABC transporter ATP-binding protein [Acidilutibacter cellobiosedens]